MHIYLTDDPTDPNVDPAADPATAAAAADPAANADNPPEDPQAAVLAAVDAALADGAPAADPPADPAAATDPAVDPAADPAAPKLDAEGKPIVDPAADPAAAPAAAKPSDEFGELPKDAKAETRERFDKMKGAYDELHVKAEAWREGAERADKWQQTVESTGATAEQFGTMLGYLKTINSGTREGLQAAFDMLKGEAEVLAKALGIPLALGGTNYDPLDEAVNADLKAKVENEGLDPTVARELAATRAGQRVDSAARETREQQQAAQTETDTALAAIRSFGAARKAADPDYAAKMALIKPGVDLILDSLPPAKWDAAIQKLYNETVVPRAPAPVDPRQHAPAAPQPLRPSGTPNGAGGGVTKTAGSALEAVEAALANMGG